jgi:hypothetical protein
MKSFSESEIVMNQNCTKKFIWLGLLAVLLLSQAAVKAGYYLPPSSLWQGSRFYNQDNVYAYVEYAVYDTAAADYHSTRNGLIDGFPNPGTGQYIYAYQIINLGTSLPPITAFSLLGGNPAVANGIGEQSDGSGGILPTNNGTSFTWKFDNGTFVVDAHSAFMVFSSDKGPIAGTLKLSSLTESGNEPPTNGGNNPVPEPTTMAILASGVFGLLTRKKDSV